MPQHSRVGMSRAMAQFGEASGTAGSVRLQGWQPAYVADMKNGVVHGIAGIAIMNVLVLHILHGKNGNDMKVIIIDIEIVCKILALVDCCVFERGKTILD